MIFLVHGEDTVSSRSFLLKLRQDYSSAETISLKNIKDPQTILPSGKGLFSEKKLIILENFSLSKTKEINGDYDYDLVLWFPETITPPSWINKAWHFKQTNSVSIFKFADSVVYGQEKQALLMLENLLLSSKEREMIIGTLVRTLKMIALSLSGEAETVSNSSFVQSKVREQAKEWDLKKVKIALLYLLKTDLWMKQGKLSSEDLLTKLTFDLCRLARN